MLQWPPATLNLSRSAKSSENNKQNAGNSPEACQGGQRTLVSQREPETQDTLWSMATSPTAWPRKCFCFFWWIPSIKCRTHVSLWLAHKPTRLGLLEGCYHRLKACFVICTIKLHRESTESRWRELREQCSSWLYAAFCLHSHNLLDVTHERETVPCQMLPNIDITFMTLPGFIRFLQFSIFIPGYFFWIWDSIMVSQAWAKHAPRAVGHLGCAARLPEVTTMGCFKMKLYQTYLYSQFFAHCMNPNFQAA